MSAGGNNVKKVKVLNLVDSMGMGGAQQLLIEYLRYFKNDPDIEFWLYVINGKTDSKYDKIIKEQNLNVHYINIPKSRCKVPYIKRYFNTRIKRKYVDEAIKDFHPDIVHTHISKLLCQVIQPIQKNQVKWCFNTLHSDPYAYRGKDVRDLRHIFQMENVIPVCITEEQADKAIKRYHLSPPIHLIKNGIDMKRLQDVKCDIKTARENLGLPSDKMIIGTVGRLNKIKQYDLLVRIFAKICEKENDVLLVLAGEGAEKENLQQLAQNLKCEHKIKFLGAVENIGCFYSAIDLFVLTSKHEAGPLVVLEAQAMGLPCIVSDAVPASFLKASNTYRMKENDTIEDWVKVIIEKAYLKRSQGNEIEDFDISHSLEKIRNLYLLYGEKEHA